MEGNKGIGFIEGLITVLIAISISMALKLVLSPLVAYPLGFALVYLLSWKKNNIDLESFKKAKYDRGVSLVECLIILASAFFLINLISESEALIKFGVQNYKTDFNNNRGIDKDVFSMLFLAPVIEEFFFRKLLLIGFLNKYKGVFKAVLLNSILFGILHFDPDAENVFGKILGAFILGLIVSSVYLKSKKLWYSIFLHFCWNFYHYIFTVLLVVFNINIYSNLELALVFLSYLVLSILLFVIGHKKGGVLS